jgi:hypothetical protein
MIHHLLVVSLLCLTAAFAADAIDHRQSWDGLRNQGTIGSCQTHVAIALLEAEHALQFAEKVDLSEAHLFLHHFLGVTPAETDANLRGMLLGAVAFDRFSSESLQSGHIFEPFRVLQTLGVLLEEDFPFAISTSRTVLLAWKHSGADSMRTSKTSAGPAPRLNPSGLACNACEACEPRR